MKDLYILRKLARKLHVEHWQLVAALLMIYDALAVILAYFLGLWLRFDGKYTLIPQHYLKIYLAFILPYAAAVLLAFWFCGLYRSMWRFASFSVLVRTLVVSMAMSCAHALLITLALGRMPISYYVWGAGMQFVLLAGVRFLYRIAQYQRSLHRSHQKATGRVMLIGAGSAGQMILKDLNNADEVKDDQVVCIIDDNPNKWHRSLEGVPIETEVITKDNAEEYLKIFG